MFVHPVLDGPLPVTTDRKPRPGLKHVQSKVPLREPGSHDGPKTQTGIETIGFHEECRRGHLSRRTENPDRD